MRLISPTDQLLSVHRHTSFLRGCNPIEESKKGSYRSYCTSMDPPNQDLNYQRPRIYSESDTSSNSFYPHHNSPPPPPSSSAILPALAKMASIPVPASRSSGEEESEEDDVKRRYGLAPPLMLSKDDQSSQSSPRSRKRKSSWPPIVGAGMEVESYDSTTTGRSSRERSDVTMNPVSSSSGLPAGERLPGIAHLDEQMHTPWSIGNARRGVARSGGGANDDSLRRLSISHSGGGGGSRSWRSSFQESGSRDDSSVPSLSHSPRLLSSLRRPTSPQHGSYDNNEHNRLQSSYQSTSDRLSHSGGASPSTKNNGPRRSPFGAENVPAYRRRGNDWSEERYGAPHPPQLPSTTSLFDERQRGATGPLPPPPQHHHHDIREESYRRSPEGGRPHERRSTYSTSASLDRPGYSYNESYSMQPRDAPIDPSNSRSRPPYQYESSTSTSSYNHRMYDRDSPSYYDELPHGRMDASSPPQHHQYSIGSNTSPNIPRRRGKLPKVVTDLLKTWLLDHASHPYPTEDEKRRLCNVTGLSISQVSNWFINARRRILVPQGSGNFALGHPTTQSSGAGGSGGASTLTTTGGNNSGGLPILQQSPSPPLHHISHRSHPSLQQQHSQSQQQPHHLLQQQQQQQHPQHHPSHQPQSHHLAPLHHHEEGIHHLYKRSNSHSPQHYTSRSTKEEES